MHRDRNVFIQYKKGNKCFHLHNRLGAVTVSLYLVSLSNQLVEYMWSCTVLHKLPIKRHIKMLNIRAGMAGTRRNVPCNVCRVWRNAMVNVSVTHRHGL